MSKFKCTICGQKVDDLRYGKCFDCAEAESIISTGVDMYDVNLEGDKETEFHAYVPAYKLKHLIKKGWRLQKELKPSKRTSAARRNNRSSRRKA